MTTLLHEPRFVGLPKPVFILNLGLRLPHTPKTPDTQTIGATIINTLQTAQSLDELHYRSGIDTSVDALLRDYGIMHIHLFKGSDDMMLFRQYDDRIHFLGFIDHRIFAQANGVKANGSYVAKQSDRLLKAQLKAEAANTDPTLSAQDQASPQP